MSAEKLTTDEAVELVSQLRENDPAWKRIRGLGIGVNTDTIKANGYETNRWSKYGNDRLYFNDRAGNEFDGYIDLDTGAVEGDTPICTVDVEVHNGTQWVLYYATQIDVDYEHEELIAALKR